MPLNPEYVKQLTEQLNLKFALTLKFMDEAPIIDWATKQDIDKIEALSEDEREALKNTVCGVIEVAIERAENAAKILRPITAKP